MIRKPHPAGGLYIKLEKFDFNGNWRGFLTAIKKLPTIVYAPVELDEPEGYWFVGKDSLDGFEKAYEEHIGKLLRQMQEDIIAGCWPMARKGGRFTKRRMR